MSFRAVFWDNDGVLVDTERLYYQATRDVMSSLGFVLSPELYRRHFLLDSCGAWHLLEGRNGPTESVQELRRRRNKRYEELLEAEARPVPGIEGVLKALYGKVLMAVVTSTRRDHFDIIHRRTGFLRYFAFVLTSDDCGQVKPEPEIYLKAVQRSGLEVGECLAIEDSQRGLLAAKAAGLSCWVIPTELTQGSDFSSADRILSSVAEVSDLLC